MIEHIINTPERLKGIIRLYKKEELESMNYIFGKTEDNKCFTKEELEAVQNMDLFDTNVVNICKIIWDNRDNKEKLNLFLLYLKEGVN